MLKTIVVAGVATVLGSLILSVPNSAQSGTKITFSDSSTLISQATQPAGQAPVNTPPIVQAPSQQMNESTPQMEMATASTGACNQCESVSAAPGSDSCEAGSAKKTVVALYAGTGKLSSQALVLEAIKHCFTPTILVT